MAETNFGKLNRGQQRAWTYAWKAARGGDVVELSPAEQARRECKFAISSNCTERPVQDLDPVLDALNTARFVLAKDDLPVSADVLRHLDDAIVQRRGELAERAGEKRRLAPR